MNGLMLILGFYGLNQSRYCISKLVVQILSLEIQLFTLFDDRQWNSRILATLIYGTPAKLP